MAKKKDAAVEAATEVSTKLKHQKNLAIAGEYTKDSEITWHVTSNPRSASKATHARFAAYFGAATVGAYVAAGGTKGDLLWDLRSGYLTIEGVSLSSEPRPKRVRKDKKAAEAAPSEQEVATEVIG